ncbi:MAG: queuosine precursor transporter [Bacteroidetes bacterium]|nr:queuosine precursor transporter [Bacteroidota bacterium]
MDKRVKLFTILAGVFLTALLLAETTGGKLIQVGFADDLIFTLTMGVIPFPVTFIVTDIINEYYGRRGIRFITILGMLMVLFALILLQIEMAIPAAAISPVSNEAFTTVFGVSTRIIVGSLTAYLIGQFVDIYVFHYLRRRTGARLLWLRATGSTVVSQFIDSFVVLFIAFLGPLSAMQIVGIGMTNYIYKFIVAVGITPILYLVHAGVDRYLGHELAASMAAEAHPGPATRHQP